MKDKIVWVHSGMSDSHKDTVVNSGNIEFPPSSHYPSSIVDWFCSLDRDTEQFPDPQDLAQYGPALMERGYYHLDQLLHGITQEKAEELLWSIGIKEGLVKKVYKVEWRSQKHIMHTYSQLDQCISYSPV